MTGETDLDTLLAGMSPALDPETYVFATVDALPPDSGALMTFREAEGLTLILPQERARALGLAGTFPCRRIILSIHSGLDAVGFLARITTELARLGVGVNPVSAFYHDHLFVPAADADAVLAALHALSRRPG